MFSNTILEVNGKKPKTVDIKSDIIRQIVIDSGVGKDIKNISEPMTWVMQLYRIKLIDDRELILKVGVIKDWSDLSAIKNQIHITKILRMIGIPQPDILYSSENKNKYGFPFILTEKQKGEKLYQLLENTTENEKNSIYFEIGKLYSKIHEIKNEWAGIWGGDPKIQKYPIHPADFYLDAELKNGSGKYLYENGIIDKKTYNKIIELWINNLNTLKEQQNTLIHNSPFPWSIYINKNKQSFSISGLSALGDFMWWDKMMDVTHILNPPFISITPEMTKSFRNGYTHQINEKVMHLYLLLTILCSIAGCYFAPVNLVEAMRWSDIQIKKTNETIAILE